MKKRDHLTPDLFKDYVPAPVVARFAQDEVKGWSPSARMSAAVAKTLADDGRSRAEIAKAMSGLIEEEVSKTILDAYASQSKDHSIPAVRLAALIAVTGDPRALNELLREFDLIAVPAKFEALLRREHAREVAERAQRDAEAADAQWRASRR